LNEAIVAARSVAIARGATALLVVPADLPAITASAVDDLVAAARRPARGTGVVVLVPDRHGTGTNVLLVAPPVLIEPAFGVDSHALHLAAAARAGATILELDGPLSLDLDTPADLLIAEAALGSRRG
jgi:2-phospho-L-lactate guanylyltransferase